MVHAGRAVVILGLAATAAPSQTTTTPINDLPNPYETIEGWAKLPDGRAWGSTSAVAIAPDGKGVWVAERCGANACAGSTVNPVYLFDATGKVQKAFGAGMMTTSVVMLRRVTYLESLLTLCASCQRIGVGGEWISLEQLVANRDQLATTHGICGDCYEEQASGLTIAARAS